jgi:hypothetical protein
MCRDHFIFICLQLVILIVGQLYRAKLHVRCGHADLLAILYHGMNTCGVLTRLNVRKSFYVLYRNSLDFIFKAYYNPNEMMLLNSSGKILTLYWPR